MTSEQEKQAGQSISTSKPTGLVAQAGPIAFYDGECGVCNRSVQFLLARDKAARLRFAALQGETAAALLAPELVQDLNTMALLAGGELHLRSTAVLRALALTGGALGSFARLGLLIPRPIRDAAYKLFARHRLRFGSTAAASCRLLTAEEAARFLP